MRNTTKTQAVELLLRALYEGTESDGPWVDHRSVEWEMEELSYHKPLDMLVPFRGLVEEKAELADPARFGGTAARRRRTHPPLGRFRESLRREPGRSAL